MITPTFAEFVSLAKTHNLIPLREEIIVDRVTPVSVYERLQKGEPYAFLLESVEGGERFGRYSFVGQRPHAIFLCQGHDIIYREGKSERRWKTKNPLLDLKSMFSEINPATLPGLPRFWGGAVGYWDYDTVRFFEKIPDTKPDQLKFPTGAFQLTGELVVFDRFSQLAQVISNVYLPKGNASEKDLKTLYEARRPLHSAPNRAHPGSSIRGRARKSRLP